MPNTSSSKRPNASQRGLGWDHQEHRKRLLMRHVDGTPCFWCAHSMFRDPARNPDGRALHADHSKSRSVNGIVGNRADRLLHGSCNESRGDGSRDHLRPALAASAAQPEPDEHARLGKHYYFDWPD